MSILDQLCVSAQQSMLEVMARVNENEQGIALVVDDERRLLDTITDGDLRRAVLAGQDLRQPISTLRSRRNGNSPITARMDTPKATLRAIMRRHSLRHIPLLDDSGCVAGLAAATDFLQSEASEQPGLAAVVMVGGEGKRLLPLTQDLPKPMLPIGDKPLLERTIARLREAGIRRVLLATHYKPQAFAEHFANGESFGVEIDYVQEEQPLGTAGALASLATKERLLVMNGDVFTEVNYRALLDFHEDSKADLTVGVRNYEFKLPYGVVQMEAEAVTSIEEKPMQRLFVNAGVYLLEPSVCQ